MSSSTTLTQLINLLTRPLIFTQPAITIAQLQLALQANLSTLFNSQPFAPFTLHFSAHALPISPIYAACLTLGLSWESWVATLSGGKDLYVFVMEGCIRVGVPNVQETVVVWKESSETKASTASKLQAMLDSARARKQANADAQASSTSTYTLPTLRITPSTPLLPSPSESSYPISTSSSSSSETGSDSDSDSDLDSDTESTTSSTTTVSSVSSNSTSFAKTQACSNAFGIPFFIPTTTTAKKAIAIPRAQRRREWVSQSQNQSQNLASLSVSPTSRATKATITNYTYQGGQTGVMTGGVMLGGSGAAAASPVTTTASRTGAGSVNWRSSSSRRV